MIHSFDVDLAEEVGVEKAVLLFNIEFWLAKNKANNKHAHDGYYWTYNSSRAFCLLFPYWNAKKIQRMLSDLESSGHLLSGRYNDVKYDQTKWYTTPSFAIGQICPMDGSEMTNRMVKSDQPIPDIKPDIKTQISTGLQPGDVETKKTKPRFCKESVKNTWNEVANTHGLPGIRGVTKSVESGLKRLYASYLEICKQDGDEPVDMDTLINRYLSKGYQPTEWAKGNNPEGKKYGIETALTQKVIDRVLGESNG